MTEIKDNNDKATRIIKEQAEIVFNSYREKLEKADAESKLLVEKMDTRLDELQKDLDAANAVIKAGKFTHGDDKKDNLEKAYSELFVTKLAKKKHPHLTQAESDLVVEYEKSINVGTANQGGHLVPTGDANAIVALVQAKVPFFGLSDVVSTSLAAYPVLIQNTNGTASRGDETTAVTNSTTPTVEEVRISSFHYEAEPWMTVEALEDAQIDIMSFIKNETAQTIADLFGDALVNGDGTGDPVGLISALALDTSSAYDTIKTIAAANADNSGAQNGFDFDDIYDTIYDLDPRFAGANLTMVMGLSAMKNLRKLRTAVGEYIWSPSLIQGQPSQFNGIPVVHTPYMPALSGGADAAVLIGDFRQGHIIVQRPEGTRIIVDELTQKKYVKFYSKQRMGAGLKDARALRCLLSKS